MGKKTRVLVVAVITRYRAIGVDDMLSWHVFPGGADENARIGTVDAALLALEEEP